jgi:hypothetical protein
MCHTATVLIGAEGVELEPKAEGYGDLTFNAGKNGLE